MTIVYDDDGFEKYHKSTIDQLSQVLDEAGARLRRVGRVRLPAKYAAEESQLNSALQGIPDLTKFLAAMSGRFDEKLAATASEFRNCDAATASAVAALGRELS